jgi:hypothetical protein
LEGKYKESTFLPWRPCGLMYRSKRARL